MELFNLITGKIVGVLWSMPLIVILLVCGIYFSLRMAFPQIRLIKNQVKCLREGGKSEEGISSFESFATTLGGRVGTGNIAGVATAICFGGPGAVFWMWIAAFSGAAIALGESTLAQVYKEKIDGQYVGGPSYYLAKALPTKALAVLYAIVALAALVYTGPNIQSYTIASAINNATGIPNYVVGLITLVLFLMVALGGARRISSVASKIVPIMAGIYLLIAVVMLVICWRQIPDMFALIFKSAFNMNAVYGAIFGSTVLYGIKRGCYSSDAGNGQGAISSAAAEVSHPVKQGLAQSFSVYIDTLLVCTATALMILSTGMYNVVNEKTGEMITAYIPDVPVGAGYVQAAIDSVLPKGTGSIFIAVALFFFAFTTLIAFGFQAEPNLAYFMKNAGEKSRKTGLVIIKLIAAGAIFLGCILDPGVAWNLADIGTGMMTWVNVIGLILVSNILFRVFRDYEKQRKLGLDPVFDPDECGVKNAELWKDIVKEKYSDLEAKKKKSY